MGPSGSETGVCGGRTGSGFSPNSLAESASSALSRRLLVLPPVSRLMVVCCEPATELAAASHLAFLEELVRLRGEEGGSRHFQIASSLVEAYPIS